MRSPWANPLIFLVKKSKAREVKFIWLNYSLLLPAPTLFISRAQIQRTKIISALGNGRASRKCELFLRVGKECLLL